MDGFVKDKLLEWGLEQWMATFQEEEIDTQKLYCLEEHEIDHLIPKYGPRAKFKKHLQDLKSQLKCEIHEYLGNKSEELSNAEAFPDTSLNGDDFCEAEDVILKKVKRIMKRIETKLSNDTELGVFLRTEINNLKREKRKVVGVFGQTGAGKSSLINAVIGETGLLPTGSLAACTTVMIKVEANTQRKLYEAEIEFITQMEWEDELWSAKNLFGDTQNDEEDDDEYGNEGHDLIEKVTAFYGDIWKNKSAENLMDRKYFREIPEFLRSVKKKMRAKTAKEIMEKTARFTRSDFNEENNLRCFWPLVKCVTVRVPNNELLKHVTIVDLPGKGDRNKSRDQMWKKVIDSCSTLWIVTNMNRAVADRDAWDILKSACSLVENGGICHNIHFICTKTDDVAVRSSSEVQKCILERNETAKDLVMKEITRLVNLKKHLRVNCFEVFTVSSREFVCPKYLEQKDTEIPKLRDFLQCVNMLHEQTFSYVSGARNILSQMKEAHTENLTLRHQLCLAEQCRKLCAEMKTIFEERISEARASMHTAYMTLEKCLTEGAEKSRSSCQESLQKIIHNESGRSFYTTLKCVVENNGIHRSKSGEVINLNSTLASFLTKSINEDFRKVFPNDVKSGQFYGVIHNFSLGTVLQMQEYKALQLLMMFLRTEEEKVKIRLIKIILNRKKMIYNSLTQTVEEIMQECYKKAATFSGKGSFEKMRHTIENYIREVKGTMFDQAKEALLSQLKQLMEDVVNILSESLHKSVALSLRLDHDSIPDISNEFTKVTKHYDELMSTEGDGDLLLSDSEIV